MTGASTTYLADWGLIESQLRADARVDVDANGDITAVGYREAPIETPAAPTQRSFGPAMLLPGFVNAHSHAFQRGIRGLTQGRGTADPSSFWSWREAMYGAANTLDPSSLYRITRAAFAEMLNAGITRVGEFHYVHHQPDGTPYDDPNELSWQVVRAAQDVGIRLTLLDVFYARAGAERAPLPEQRRFCDRSVDAYLQRVDALRAAGVEVGITPHSIRAATAPQIRELAAYANTHGLPIHTHLSEQPRENEECLAEHGDTPAAVFESVGAMERARAFTAVHAVHITAADVQRLSRQTVCACPTTEADLGDGIVAAGRLHDQGTNLALGSDSNAVIDLVQEVRLLEMDDRLASQRRLRLCEPGSTLGPALARIASHGGALSLQSESTTFAAGRPFDAALFDLTHPFFAQMPAERGLDALLTAGTAAPLRQVIVGGIERV